MAARRSSIGICIVRVETQKHHIVINVRTDLDVLGPPDVRASTVRDIEGALALVREFLRRYSARVAARGDPPGDDHAPYSS